MKTSRLCLSCGFCCNGALFRDVELQPGEEGERLRALGLSWKTVGRKTRLPQPCAALCRDNRCAVYSDRPQHCRQFECALFQKVALGKVGIDQALRIVRAARRQHLRLIRGLRQLGDNREDLPVLARFQRTARRLERGAASSDEASQFADLGAAFHQWQLLLRRRFFP